VRILAEVRKEVDAQLFMVGDGPDRGPAERLARELGVEHHTIFMGKQNHVERLIPQAHVLLMPSEMESFGLAALEGMACGLPSVTTRVGGIPELVTHGVDGFLEDVGDISAQAARAIELLSDDTLHERMAKAARQTATSRFCTDLIIPQYEKYYDEIVAAR
jgi:N-acetyl-alpha-D-glucosaminyl L-malate synthase BshA